MKTKTKTARCRGWWRRAQSSTEHIVFVTAVVSVVVVFMNPSSGLLQGAMTQTYNMATNHMIILSERLDDSYDAELLGSAILSAPGVGGSSGSSGSAVSGSVASF